jgi:hypothetical protein
LVVVTPCKSMPARGVNEYTVAMMISFIYLICD